jgi:hypothetical protein
VVCVSVCERERERFHRICLVCVPKCKKEGRIIDLININILPHKNKSLDFAYNLNQLSTYTLTQLQLEFLNSFEVS